MMGQRRERKVPGPYGVCEILGQCWPTLTPMPLFLWEVVRSLTAYTGWVLASPPAAETCNWSSVGIQRTHEENNLGFLCMLGLCIKNRAGDTAQWIECLPSTHQSWVQALALHKPGVMVPACNPCTWEVKEEDRKFKAILGNIWVQSQPRIYETLSQKQNMYKIVKDYIKNILKTKPNKTITKGCACSSEWGCRFISQNHKKVFCFV